ncbi:MAG: class I SAM-dependent methyltransferase [Candidatus Aminicenantes bacterium]|nr:MAG: class I SAM-dependent methyltransferase [Candidatus Aminicenantes bacterium]
MKQEKPWYVEWFDENYLEVYRHRNTKDAQKQVQLIINTLKLSKQSTILDLGCGEGRYTAIFKNQGYQVLGLDLSETLVKYGKKKNPQLDLVVGDMRFIPGRFDLILSLFTSFGYFEEDEENERVIRSVYQSLDPGGIYWLDFLNAEYVKKNLVPENVSCLSSGIKVLEKRKIENHRIIKNIYFRKNNIEKCYKESVRLFAPQDLERMFQKNGFRVVDCFGDYNGNPCGSDSERTILVGKKQGE